MISIVKITNSQILVYLWRLYIYFCSSTRWYLAVQCIKINVRCLVFIFYLLFEQFDFRKRAVVTSHYIAFLNIQSLDSVNSMFNTHDVKFLNFCLTVSLDCGFDSYSESELILFRLLVEVVGWVQDKTRYRVPPTKILFVREW